MKNLKRAVAVFCMAVLVLSAVPFTVKAATGDVEILLNGKALVQNNEIGFAVIKDGRTMVPLRLVVESLGFKADWEVDGEDVITMKGQGKTVYHRVGELQATDLSPVLQGAKAVATTDVPSYVDSKTGRTMVGLRLISEAFGVDIKWERNTSGVGGKVIMTTEVPTGNDVVKLDEDNFVLRSQVVDRLSKQKVLDSNSKFGIEKYRTIAEQAKEWSPFHNGNDMSHVIGRPVLVERAEGYMHGVYNLDAQKLSATDWINQYLGYIINLKMVGRDERNDWQQNYLSLWPSMQAQKLNMETVFVTSEDLVYMLQEDEAYLTRAKKETYLTPWAVRGTMFYKFHSMEGDSNFWSDNGYQTGQWYWQDIEIRFGVNENDKPNYLAVTSPDKTIFIDEDGSYVHGEIKTKVRPLSTFR